MDSKINNVQTSTWLFVSTLHDILTIMNKHKDNSPIRRSVNKDQRYEGTVTSCFHPDTKGADSSEILVHGVTFS